MYLFDVFVFRQWWLFVYLPLYDDNSHDEYSETDNERQTDHNCDRQLCQQHRTSLMMMKMKLLMLPCAEKLES